jgi:hypothetical protein
VKGATRRRITLQEGAGRVIERRIGSWRGGQQSLRVGMARFLDYVRSKPDVWITSRLDIARHWMTTHLFQGKA